ncbi:MAG: hypothetical protein B7Y90_16230 [Alphaproteobacteria bacterium 32-64-14]|nr:MAG: hypothetical protein B7Y90_16230 [Alphaproteobacteria bacterium 32-64-14]
MRREPVANSVDAWLKRLAPEQRAALEKLRAQILAAAPGAEETISYGMPTFVLHGHLVAFGAFKKHLSFFPMNSVVIAENADALEGFVTSKGTIQFTPDKPIPAALIGKIVKAQIAQNLEVASERAAAKKAKGASKPKATK